VNKIKVLILSSIYDFSTDLVVLDLKKRGVPFVRLNKEQLGEYQIALDPVKPSLIINSENKTYHLNDGLKSIWFRQPVFLRNTPAHPLSVEQQLIRSQWNAFLRSLSVFSESNWMNFPQNTYLAECKPYQLKIAKQCGFSIPETIVGNDSKCINNIFQKKMIIKSLDTVLLKENDDLLFTYSTCVEPDELSQESTQLVPFIAQKYIEDKVDCRVTIIGEVIFSVKIMSNGQPVPGDWRTLSKENLEYEDYKLPEKIVSSCKRIMKNMKLNFGAIDLLITDDEIYFLEINPTGEWGWLCNNGRKIDQVISHWLSL